ncbi:hypothetical protein [Janthinobacterium sp. FW305-129]|uniref:hypothetical protein n=1 Tax=Janthinobacterium sp. FW305-129 TaxID=2775054 RepID=UPI001E536C47|nr:hypothetical protein [Janthinobacterium sp. FW305-129]
MDTRQFIPAFFVFEVVGVIKIGGVGEIYTVKLPIISNKYFPWKLKKVPLPSFDEAMPDTDLTSEKIAGYCSTMSSFLFGLTFPRVHSSCHSVG